MAGTYPVLLWPRRLQQALELLPPGAPPRPIPVIAPSRRPRWPWAVSLGGVVATGVILGGIPGLLVLGVGLGLVGGGYVWESRQYWLQCQHYQDRQAIYHQQKRVFEQWLGEHEQEVQHLRQPKIQQALQKVMAYPEPARQPPQSGVSEVYLHSFLIQYFPGMIHSNLALGDPIKTQKRPYYPDFTYINKTLNLYLDIEIDEPYFYSDNRLKPHHIKDEKRNEFFLAAGWVVVRFSEYQVVTQPKSCCKYIAETIAQVQQTPLGQVWKSIRDLEPDPQWNEAKANQFIGQRTRYRYLKQYLPKDIFQAQKNYINRL
ncbi:hypothetical protein GlitD10_2864 [Gloeomargarita lithophora Alchichica-D10]|uniref:DUF559 domain-containing protein n=1 Tax=Gloeomargarita lithophora Alchichica-D10 TaxID=1188229 RepID=A0A1J0AH33_9CYAN|nr:hypothetical protein [Gloeomargarita lithophora]APB35208.1 hypothetical protein GlitD10_2864 [Gloeomargarita lithophora Alchichica-D10]